MRQKVEQTLCEQKGTVPPKIENDSLLLIEIVTEFLRYMGMNATASTLEAEAGVQAGTVRREHLIS